MMTVGELKQLLWDYPDELIIRVFHKHKTLDFTALDVYRANDILVRVDARETKK